MRSVIETIGTLLSKANFLKVAIEAMEPSSESTTADRTETGCKPASVTKSTEASVWPTLLRTPPFLYLRGNTWPGLIKSPGLDSGEDRASTVFALSEADTPVDVPTLASYIITAKLNIITMFIKLFNLYSKS